MIIVVPTSVAVILAALGIALWISEQQGKARKRREVRETRARLHGELTTPPPPAQLPYGLSPPSDSETGNRS